MPINYRKCLRCGHKGVPIVYGYPSVELAEQAAAGKISLGGCCISQDNPAYHCNECKHQWNREEAELAAYGEITGIKASVGGYFDGFCLVHIDITARQLTWAHSLDDPETAVIKNLTKKTLEKIPVQLRRLDLLNWKRRYDDNRVLDGTQWQVEIFRKGRALRKSGSNGYPEQWDDFCQLMQKLSGMPFA